MCSIVRVSTLVAALLVAGGVQGAAISGISIAAATAGVHGRHAKPGFVTIEEMNMDELESLADNLINNRQKSTAQGTFAQDYGMMLLSQISSSREFVEQYFKKDKT